MFMRRVEADDWRGLPVADLHRGTCVTRNLEKSINTKTEHSVIGRQPYFESAFFSEAILLTCLKFVNGSINPTNDVPPACL